MSSATFQRPTRSFVDFCAAALCLWAAAYHTPVGALIRDGFARVFSVKVTTRPLLAYYSGGVYDAQQITVPVDETPRAPDGTQLALVPPGRALGRGVFATVTPLGTDRRKPAEALAQRYGLSLTTPDEASRVLERARAELGSDDAAVLALFAGYEVASFASRRVQAEGEDPTLEALSRRLPPSSTKALGSASTALMLGTAYALSWPVAPGTRVTSPFGWRHHPLLGRDQFHTGVDLSVPSGTAVHAVADGVVRRASEDAVNGRVVIIEHGRGVTTAYCHNSLLHVRVGDRVSAGDVIADSGSTGRSTGPHVHYQLELGHQPVDPFAFRGTTPVLIEPSQPAAIDDDGGARLRKAFEAIGPTQ